ncbi:MAG: hypothetical protein CMC13_14710 [Flavobacteriaceae bacterium]|nr:hypothetical protein [Flavobacteriaceae bacterium]|tara:strand:- start:1289 stop:2419 length:1131 start_codon:yes stop_codon:yes gene_type:complete
MKNSIFILIIPILLLSCKDQPKNGLDSERIDKISKTDADSSNGDLENTNELLQKSSPYTRDSRDFFGVEALVFNGNTVRFSVASLYVRGEVIDREDITGTYKVSGAKNNLIIQFDFNTNFVFVDYLIDGSKKSGKSIKEVTVPYILKVSITDDGLVLSDGWENDTQSNKRIEEEKKKLEEANKIEDYGIDKDVILGAYKGVDKQKEVYVNIISLEQKEIGHLSKRGLATGILKTEGKEIEFNSNYHTSSDGNKYTINIDYKEHRGYTYGIRFVYESEMKYTYYGGSSMYNPPLKNMEKIDKEIEEKSGAASQKTYYKINDPDGYSNLRDKPNGEIVRKVFENKKFELISTSGEYKKVKLSDGTVGYIHSSRVIEHD